MVTYVKHYRWEGGVDVTKCEDGTELTMGSAGCHNTPDSGEIDRVSSYLPSRLMVGMAEAASPRIAPRDESIRLDIGNDLGHLSSRFRRRLHRLDSAQPP